MPVFGLFVSRHDGFIEIGVYTLHMLFFMCLSILYRTDQSMNKNDIYIRHTTIDNQSFMSVTVQSIEVCGYAKSCHFTLVLAFLPFISTQIRSNFYP